jgi:hypothetical protein
MKLSLVLLVGGTAAAAAVASVSTGLVAAPVAPASRRSVSLEQLPPAAPAGQQVLFGHIKSLARRNGRFELRFDPAWLLTGVAAERAAVEDGVLAPGEPVPNDSYVVDESHRLLTFVVSPSARVTLVGKRLVPIVVPVSELAQIVKGKNPKRRPLFDRGRNLGYWIRISAKYPNGVVSIDQQYHP